MSALYYSYQVNLKSLSLGYTNCFTITWEVNSVFPGQSIIHSYLAFKPLYLPRDFEFHFHRLSKECCVWRFVHICIPKVKSIVNK